MIDRVTTSHHHKVNVFIMSPQYKSKMDNWVDNAQLITSLDPTTFQPELFAAMCYGIISENSEHF